MNIFFYLGSNFYKENNDLYNKILRQLKRMRHQIIDYKEISSQENSDNLINSNGSIDFRKYVANTKASIYSSDVVLVEVTETTPELGFIIAFALENEIPVIAYSQYDSNYYLSPFVIGNTHPLYTYRKYLKDKIEETLKMDMLYISNLINNQFTFVISPGIKAYLDWCSKYRKISRGLLIRLLIEEKIKNDNDFKEYKGDADLTL